MSCISSLNLISAVVPDAKIFLYIPASAAYAAVVNRNAIKKLLVNGEITFFINGNPTFNLWTKTSVTWLYHLG